MSDEEIRDGEAPTADAEVQRRREEEALQDLLNFPFVDALFGRRSRRFFRGAEVPDGPLAFKSRHRPIPLSELERLLILTAAGGRTFPSAAGFHTAELFFTDDSGTYIFETRDAPAMGERQPDGTIDVLDLVMAHRSRIRQLSDKRIYLPPKEPYMEGHNTWVANRPGSLLLFPVGDVAQHTIANLCFYTQNGYCIYDDVNGRQIPGLEPFADIVDVANPVPLTFLDQYSLTECTAELSTAAYAGMLMLQAMGLGGWMFNGIDRLSMLGASGGPDVPGLGFRYDTDER